MGDPFDTTKFLRALNLKDFKDRLLYLEKRLNNGKIDHEKFERLVKKARQDRIKMELKNDLG